MTDITKLLQHLGAKAALFPSNSRYAGTPVTSMENSDGDSIVYLKRRMVPGSESFVLLEEHTVTEGERLDNITEHYLGDPERFWQICDANDVLHPDDLTQMPGKKIRITLPEGLQG